MLAKLFQFVKAHIDIVIMTAVVVLLVLFSFAAGYIMAKYQQRPEIKIESGAK